jgi:hypothetical protein
MQIHCAKLNSKAQQTHSSNYPFATLSIPSFPSVYFQQKYVKWRSQISSSYSQIRIVTDTKAARNRLQLPLPPSFALLVQFSTNLFSPDVNKPVVEGNISET